MVASERIMQDGGAGEEQVQLERVSVLNEQVEEAGGGSEASKQPSAAGDNK